MQACRGFSKSSGGLARPTLLRTNLPFMGFINQGFVYVTKNICDAPWWARGANLCTEAVAHSGHPASACVPDWCVSATGCHELALMFTLAPFWCEDSAPPHRPVYTSNDHHCVYFIIRGKLPVLSWSCTTCDGKMVLTFFSFLFFFYAGEYTADCLCLLVAAPKCFLFYNTFCCVMHIKHNVWST